MNEVVRYKKLLERQQLDSSKREVRVSELRHDAEKGLTALEEADNKISYYRREVRYFFYQFFT